MSNKEINKQQMDKINGGAVQGEYDATPNPEIWFKPVDTDAATNPISGMGIGGGDPYNAGQQILTTDEEPTQTGNGYVNPWK